MGHLKSTAVSGALAVILALVLMGTAYARAAEPAPRTFDIGPQSLATALREFARQGNVELLFAPGVVAAKTTVGVRGMLEPLAALGELLRDTGLAYTTTPNGAVLVGPAPAGGQRVLQEGTETGRRRGESWDVSQRRSFFDRFRLAQVDQGKTASDRSAERSDTAPEEKSARIEEIVVTAQKREERVFYVPMSIVAMGPAELRQRRISGIDDLASAVPGLSIQSNGSTRRLFLRGISNITGNSSLIGLYLDEASATTGDVTQLDLRTYDLERIEVLRGPQGTLYGEGSAGGTIRFITRAPSLEHFSANADLSAQFTDGGAPGQRIEGTVNVPLVENTLGLRIAGTFDHGGGWIDQPAASREDVNDQDLTDVRVRGLWQASPDFSVNATALFHRNDGPISIGESSGGDFRQVFNLTTAPRTEDDYELYNLTAAYDLSAVRLLSTSSFIKQGRDTKTYGYRLLGSDIYYPLLARKTEVFTQELRVTSRHAGALQWTVGGYFRDASLDTDAVFHFGAPVAPGVPLPAPFTSTTKATSESWATFGDAKFQITRLSIGAGVRYFRDDQGLTVAALQQRGTFDAVTGRLYTQFEFTDHLNAYASAAEGFRTGGFNALNQPRYNPERVRTYELGMKMRLLDDRLSADMALFHNNYTNYQITGVLPAPAPPLAITSNAGSAEIDGIELAVTLRPTAKWSLSLNGNYVDSEFTKINASSSSYIKGDQLDFFPKYSYTVSLQRDFQWIGRSGSVRLDYDERGKQTYRNRRFGATFFNESDVIGLLNLNVDLRWSDSLSFSLYAQNLLDDRGYIDPQSIQDLAPRSKPLTLGIALGMTFD